MPKQHVILAHGLASSSVLLRPIASHLRKAGFQTKFWSYFSIRGSIELHASRLRRLIENYSLADGDQLHLIGHSMGSIISRRVVLDLEPQKIRRLIMLAPPNHGSRVATNLSRYLGGFCPALHELSDREDSYVRCLGVPQNIEIGIVGAEGDLVVSDESTRLGVETDFISFPGMHTGLLFRKDVRNSIVNFLELGCFESSAERASQTSM